MAMGVCDVVDTCGGQEVNEEDVGKRESEPRSKIVVEIP
jgi:hypothetical protein